MEAIEKIKAGIAEIKKKKEELTEQLRQDFPEILKPIFDKSEKIKSIGWNQYTPYFNDGDPCEFSVNLDLDYCIYINGIPCFEEEEEEGQSVFTISSYGIKRFLNNDDSYEKWIKQYPEDSIDPIKNADEIELYKTLEELVSILSSISDEFYLDLFGDHVQVTVNRDGTVETEQYDHD